jgi:hypothetical protein
MQLVAYGAQNVYQTSSPQITFFRTCNSTMSFRKYDNFDIIFDDTKIGKELYYASELIHIFL